jgi:hypothetical protein
MSHPAKAGRPGAPEHPHEDGFRLIVGRVAEGDAVTAVVLRQFIEKPITQVAGCFLHRPTSSGSLAGEPGPFDQQRDVSVPAEGRHERFILIRFMAAEPVIEMHGRKTETPLGSHVMEAGQQRD